MEGEATDVVVEVAAETDLAYLLRNEDGDEEWFPKSEVFWSRRTAFGGVANIPDWLLEDRGW